MKLFFSKLFLLGMLLVLLLNFIVAPVLIGVADRIEFLPWSYIYARVLNAKKKHSFKKIVMGDSVGTQLFQPRNCAYSFSTNGSVLLAGNYMLLQEYLNKNPAPDTLIFVFNPSVFATDFYDKLVYNSFCKPFNTSRNQVYFTTELDSLISTHYKYRLTQYPFYKILGCIDDPALPVRSDSAGQFISGINLSYLKKIDTLVKSKHIYCRFVSPSVNRKSVLSGNQINSMKEAINNAGCAYMFSTYWASVQYLDSIYFRDNLHYSETYLQKHLVAEQTRLEAYY